MQNYIERLEKVCCFLLDSIDGHLELETYNSKLRQKIEEEFGNRAFEHIAHWVLRECGLDLETKRDGSNLEQYVFLRNVRPDKNKIRKVLEKYKNDIKARATNSEF